MRFVFEMMELNITASWLWFLHPTATIREGVLPENYSVAPFHLSSVSRNKSKQALTSINPDGWPCFQLVLQDHRDLLFCSQFTYCGPDPVHKYLTLVVDDGIQPPVELSCKDRNIMAATFIRFLHKNIGLSQSNVIILALSCTLNTLMCSDSKRQFNGIFYRWLWNLPRQGELLSTWTQAHPL